MATSPSSRKKRVNNRKTLVAPLSLSFIRSSSPATLRTIETRRLSCARPWWWAYGRSFSRDRREDTSSTPRGRVARLLHGLLLLLVRSPSSRRTASASGFRPRLADCRRCLPGQRPLSAAKAFLSPAFPHQQHHSLRCQPPRRRVLFSPILLLNERTRPAPEAFPFVPSPPPGPQSSRRYLRECYAATAARDGVHELGQASRVHVHRGRVEDHQPPAQEERHCRARLRMVKSGYSLPDLGW